MTMDLIDIRVTTGGQLEYRQRLTEMASVTIPDSWGEQQEFTVISDKWGPWQKVEGVKGDDSDRRWD